MARYYGNDMGEEVVPTAEELINVRICFGSFSRDGRWHPNCNLEMTVEEQRQHNIDNGYLTPEGNA